MDEQLTLNVQRKGQIVFSFLICLNVNRTVLPLD